MSYISIICPTMRVGGLDVLFDSLAKQTFTDFELVLVDALYERRKKIVLNEARDRFLAVRHVGLSPTPKVCAFSTFSNAGIVASTGEVLLFMVDYSRLPPDLLERHARFHRAHDEHAGFMGPHRYASLSTSGDFPAYGRNEIDRYDQDIDAGRLDRFMFTLMGGDGIRSYLAGGHSADGGVTVPADADPKLRLPPGSLGPEFFHAKNESVKRGPVIAVNGYDQELDGAHLYQDSDFADRLTVKGGVQWTLDPNAVVEIVNPRHIFPFARRTREHQENFAIWQRKKARGYIDPPRKMLHESPVREEVNDLSVGRVEEVTMCAAPMRIAMIYGEFSSHGHGPYLIDKLYTEMGLTGSEGSFFNLARSLCERGHEVAVFCDTPTHAVHESGFNAVPIRELERMPQFEGVKAVIAWNEPDYLRFAPPGAKRYCDQQLNDFGYCRAPGWQQLVDQWVSPSENHRHNVMQGLPATCVVIPNSVDLDLFAGPAPVRDPHRVVWCSSPDRGLHNLLSAWPIVRQRVPDATLRVFYKLAPWLAHFATVDDECGRRARYIDEALKRLQGHGVEVYDLVPNARMAQELRSAAALVYPCEPVRYTEGFGCSVLDATAAGCVPIISQADALPSVHGSASIVVHQSVHDRNAWADTIVTRLNGPENFLKESMKLHAELHARQRIAAQWEALLQAS